MKLILVLLLAVSVSAQKDEVVATFKSLVSDYLGANTPKACDMVANDAIALMTMDDIAAHLRKEIIGLVPASKYLPAMGMLTTFQSCVKKAGSSMERVTAAVGGAFKKALQPLLTTVQDKVQTMKKNKAANEDILKQVYSIAKNKLNKEMVQNVINAVMTQCTKAEYDCATPPLNTVMPTKQYNMAYDAKRG